MHVRLVVVCSASCYHVLVGAYFGGTCIGSNTYGTPRQHMHFVGCTCQRNRHTAASRWKSASPLLARRSMLRPCGSRGRMVCARTLRHIALTCPASLYSCPEAGGSRMPPAPAPRHAPYPPFASSQPAPASMAGSRTGDLHWEEGFHNIHDGPRSLSAPPVHRPRRTGPNRTHRPPSRPFVQV